ncbi:MAG: hypothetical protein R3A79_03555 [Nannocystaceae bacterium]
MATTKTLISFDKFISTCISFTFLLVLVFGILQWLEVSVGELVDWIVAVVTFWWLMILVTIPWNLHFQAREVLAEGLASAEEGLALKPERAAYIRRWMRRTLILALVLHVVSAGGLYWVAASGLSVVGYIGAGAALLLTGLRPLIRAYEYLASQLFAIQRELRYPKDNVVALKARVDELEGTLKTIEAALDRDKEESWAAEVSTELRRLRDGLEAARGSVGELRESNRSEHAALERRAEVAVAQLSEDSQFLQHVREIIRFVKGA